jgi:hypothetical protein
MTSATEVGPPAAPVGRPFVGRFLLPLVRGGPLHVGRPLGARAIELMASAWRPGVRRSFTSLEDMAEEDAMVELARLRHARARTLLAAATAPPLDETSVRLAVGLHNLLALGHPGLGAGLAAGVSGRQRARALEQRRAQIVDATLPLADLGPPPSAEEAIRRHSLLARMGEITRTEHTVEYWAGRRRFVGRPPPAHLLALPRLRRVATSAVRRMWFKEIGVPVCGRPLWIALHRASPLGEALDPARLDPPLAWERILPVLRFAPLARTVAGQVVELGLESAGGAMVAALLRFVALSSSAGATPAAVAFAIRFLAHAFWLHQLYRSSDELSPASDIAAVLVAAEEIAPSLIWPDDVSAGVDPALRANLQARLARLGPAVRSRAPDRYQLALTICRFAAPGGRGPAIVGNP